jgi:ribosomal 30S subunit maturation factor RimM
MKAGEWVYLGFVERAHGLHGRVVARLVLAGGVGPVAEGTVLRLDDTKHRVVRSTVRDSERIILQFEDLFSREQADEMQGMSIFLNRSSVFPEEGLLPLHAFVGMKVHSGCFSGYVVDVEPSVSNPQLLVEGEKGLFPIPLTMIAAGETDWDSGLIEIDLPEGLQDMVVER